MPVIGCSPDIVYVNMLALFDVPGSDPYDCAILYDRLTLSDFLYCHLVRRFDILKDADRIPFKRELCPLFDSRKSDSDVILRAYPEKLFCFIVFAHISPSAD